MAPDEIRRRLDASEARSDQDDADAIVHDEIIAEQTAAAFLHAENRSDAQDETAKRRQKENAARLRSLAIGITIGLLCLGLVSTVILRSVRNAQEAAARADQAGICAALVFESVAQQEIVPEAVEQGCDTTEAETIITRSLARDAEIAKTKDETNAQVCGVLALLSDLPPEDPNVMAFRKRLGCV